MLVSLGKVTEKQGRCPRCGSDRTPKMLHSISGGEGLEERTLGEIGLPPWDILAGRDGMNQRFYEFGGDRAAVLGGLAT